MSLYAELAVTTNFSFLRGASHPQEMVATAQALGLAAIGNELENPFGNDVNDLPLDMYCAELSTELDTLTSVPAPKFGNIVRQSENRVLWPLSEVGFESWNGRSVADIRSALRSKVVAGKGGSVSMDGSTLDA